MLPRLGGGATVRVTGGTVEIGAGCTPESKQVSRCTNVQGVSIASGGGNDTISTSAGIDVGFLVDAGPGDDTVRSGAAIDNLHGGDGNDTMDAGGGGDEIDGGDGNDTLIGGEGSDGLRGDAPASNGIINLAAAETGDDVLLGGPGPDRLDGGPGSDRLDGGAADDAIQGGDGLDTVDYSGRSEAVEVTIGDVVLGGIPLNQFEIQKEATKAAPNPNPAPAPVPPVAQVDVAVIATNDGSAVDQGSGTFADRRDSVANDVEVVLGGSGDDRIGGNALANDLRGNAGNDILDGGGAADRLDGGDGGDDLRARDGLADAALACGPGADRLTADPQDPVGSGCEADGLVVLPLVAVAPGATVAPVVLPLLVPKPKVTILTRSARLSRRGDAAVRVRCVNAPSRCRALLRLVAVRAVTVRVGRTTVRLRKGQVLARRAFTVWARIAKPIPLRVSAATRAVVGRRGSLAVRATIEAVDDGSPARAARKGTASRTVTLLAPQPVRRTVRR